MTTIIDQCAEVLHNIFSNLEPIDLSALSKTCKTFNAFINSDELLWKTIYLCHFDAPSSKSQKPEFRWSTRLKRLVDTQKILESHNYKIKNDHLEQVLMDCIALLEESTSNPMQNVTFLLKHFTPSENVSTFLCRSSLFSHSRYDEDIPASTLALRQLSAQLHVYSTFDVEPTKDEIDDKIAQRVHSYARARVYDLRRYTEGNFWGPFMDDGSGATDWEKVQNIMVDICYNLRQYTETPRRPLGNNSETDIHLWNKPFYGVAPSSYVNEPLPGDLAPIKNPDLIAQDPYGVTGTWMRIVCFLDFNDLWAFNFNNQNDLYDEHERAPITTREAFRLIRLCISVTRIEPPGEDDDPDMPVVHFTGTSKATYMPWDPNANSKIRGTVRTTRAGAIRWTSFSIYHGSERWRSEGVQLGGTGSARGILGNWFDKDYDVQGPVGPTALWKVSDDIHEEKVVEFSDAEARHQALQRFIAMVFD